MTKACTANEWRWTPWRRGRKRTQGEMTQLLPFAPRASPPARVKERKQLHHMPNSTTNTTRSTMEVGDKTQTTEERTREQYKHKNKHQTQTLTTHYQVNPPASSSSNTFAREAKGGGWAIKNDRCLHTQRRWRTRHRSGDEAAGVTRRERGREWRRYSER